MDNDNLSGEEVKFIENLKRDLQKHTNSTDSPEALEREIQSQLTLFRKQKEYQIKKEYGRQLAYKAIQENNWEERRYSKTSYKDFLSITRQFLFDWRISSHPNGELLPELHEDHKFGYWISQDLYPIVFFRRYEYTIAGDLLIRIYPVTKNEKWNDIQNADAANLFSTLVVYLDERLGGIKLQRIGSLEKKEIITDSQNDDSLNPDIEKLDIPIRDKFIIQFFRQGLSDKEIADKLGMSPRSIANDLCGLRKEYPELRLYRYGKSKKK